jgi:hypothetical protein
MVTISVRSKHGEKETVKKLLLEERKRISFAIERASIETKKHEKKYGYSTSVFIENFLKSEIEEDEDTFEWWAEAKLAGELKEKLKAISDIEICQ